MSKKKIHAKLQQLRIHSRRWQHARLRDTCLSRFIFSHLTRFTHAKPRFLLPVSQNFALVALFFSLLVQVACATSVNGAGSKVLFASPPAVGSWLKAQRELVACDTIAAAKFMGDFGFTHPQCRQLTYIGPREYKVQERTKVELSEGPMWLLQVQREESTQWVPIPWHDWL